MKRGRSRSGICAVVALSIACGCVDTTEEEAGRTGAAAPSAAERTAAPAPLPDTATRADTAASPPRAAAAGQLRLQIDLSERELRVYEGGELVETHPVAVGRPEYPTPAGEYTVGQVVWNPEWIPPDSPWAEEEPPAAPGDPDNPLGRAQLVFDLPYSIHGTTDTESLGKAESHGSVRVSNRVIVDLARRTMEAGGAPRPESFYDDVERRRTEKVVVDLPRPVPLEIRP